MWNVIFVEYPPVTGCPRMFYTGQQDFFISFSMFSINIIPILYIIFYFYIHLAMTRILNLQNRTCLVKVISCFIKLEKSEFRRMRLSQQVVNSMMC